MKILKYGEGYPKTITCEQCNSELEYEGTDIFEHTDFYRERSETFKLIKCPVCGEEIMVDVVFCELKNAITEKKKRWVR